MWLDQVRPELQLAGTEVENGLELYLMYFRPKEEDFRLIEQTEDKAVFKRKDFVNAIANACNMLGLDVIEVNNKVYARAMNCMFERINLDLKHVFINYQAGWYDEMIEKAH
jgi:hypothetical protein